MQLGNGSKGTSPRSRTEDSPPTARSQRGGPLVHVPVGGGTCAVIPRADLQSWNHLVIWTRFYAAYAPSLSLWNNAAWRETARRLALDELDMIARGDRDALARLLVALPQALEFPECNSAVVEILARREASTLVRLGKELQRRKRLRPNQRQADDAAKAFEVFNSKMFRWQLTAKDKRGRPPTLREAVTLATGGTPDELARARRVYENAQLATDREITMYRVEQDVTPCRQHADKANRIWEVARDPRADPGCPGILDPEAVPTRRTRQRLPRPGLHMIWGLDG